MKNFENLGDLVETADGSLTLRHPGHSETYHSFAGAETEARELYVKSSGFIAALGEAAPLRVLDVGLGLAYNAMATFDAWLAAPDAPALTVVSLEHNEDLVTALAKGEAGWAANWPEARLFLASSIAKGVSTSADFVANYVHPNSGALFHWEIYIGDANATMSRVTGLFQFVWQDPFSPEKNPDMWSEGWFSVVREHCAPDAVLMSYSVARIVKDALTAARWQYERIATPVQHKKHWLRAKPV